MFINNLDEIKVLIQNNIELFRLHDYIRGHQSDTDVSSICQSSMFNKNRPVFYTEINSLYSSISLIYQYIKNQSHNPNSLDNNFSYGTWFIQDCFQHDCSGTISSITPDLKTILRRFRNSVSHGSFELNSQFDSALNYEIYFYDENKFSRSISEKCFTLKFKAMDLIKFLEKLESSFKIKYP